MNILYQIPELFFPPKCVLCSRLLARQETDLCAHCRQSTQEFKVQKEHNSLVARSVILWYYRDAVRESLLRYKFGGRESYARSYGRLLAMKLQCESFDLITWVPVSPMGKFRRGYDQVQLIARQISRELEIPAISTLQKVRRTSKQSRLQGVAARRANVLNAYRAVDPHRFAGKKVLLLDDIITTGATLQECERVLLVAGAAKVLCAAVAGSDSHPDK